MTRVTAVLFFCSALLLRAQTPEPILTETATQLAARIASLLPHPTTVLLETQSLTPAPAAEWSKFRGLLLDQLRSLGLATAATQPESRVRITLAENSRGPLVVAEILTGDHRQVLILPWNLPASNPSKPRIAINQKVVWKQADPILDLLVTESGMLVLSTNSITSFGLTDNKWLPLATASLVLPRPMPRDPRGRLASTTAGFQAFLPVATCAGAWNPELKLTCGSNIANWPGTVGTHWLADRNVLEGEAPVVNTPAANAPAANYEGWGSDSTAIADPCSGGTVAIASSSDNEHDSVRVYEIADGQATPASDVLPLSGPVTALWRAESGREATLVVHNLQTGEYEASRLVLACNQ